MANAQVEPLANAPVEPVASALVEPLANALQEPVANAPPLANAVPGAVVPDDSEARV